MSGSRELEALKVRIVAMMREMEKAKQWEMLQSQVGKHINRLYGDVELDGRSVFIGNIDVTTSSVELEQHFHGCGSVNSITIFCTKYDGQPKAFAYIEFGHKDSVQTAMKHDKSIFNGQQIKVMMKGTAGHVDTDSMVEDTEFDAIKARVREMEEEAEKRKMVKSLKENQISLQGAGGPPKKSIADQMEIDERSVYVSNVDRNASAEELEQHFRCCGSVRRVSILYDPINGSSKGSAFVEFGNKDSIPAALELSDSFFKTRRIRIAPKRTDIPKLTSNNRGLSATRGRGTVRGGRSFAHSSGFRPTYRPDSNSHRSYCGETYSPY